MGHIYNPHKRSGAKRFFSTNLNPRVFTFEELGQRIAMALGWPQVNVETHQDQVFDNIAIACELFSKFAGYTEEYLVFHSQLYEKGRGLSIEKLFCYTPELRNKTTDATTASVSGNALTSSLSANDTHVTSTSAASLSGDEICDKPGKFEDVEFQDNDEGARVGWDYDLNTYRKVVDVFSFEQGSTTGINTLFTIEQTLAQQTYFSYALGKYGFDLISWYTLKNWLDVRSKLLSQDFYFKFDSRRQRLYLTPDPNIRTHTNFYGVVGAYLERPVKDLIVEPWVYQYALALTKISIARIRGKYGGVALFGGGQLAANELLSEGLREKENLENQLYEGTPGFGDANPPMFFVG